MTHLIDKDAVLAEIERRKKEWSYGSSTEAKYKVEAYKELIEWLDTLGVKEVKESEDLKKAIGEYCSNPENFITYIDVGFKQSPIKKDDIPLIIKAIEFGARWQKEQMMKNSVEAIVREDSNGYLYVYAAVYRYNGFSRLDKVKAIIIKEE